MSKRAAKKMRAQAQAQAKIPTQAPANTGRSSGPSSFIKSSVPVARYDAAGHGRRLRGWNAPSSGPNVSLAGLETLRNRWRDAERNEWAAQAGERVWVTNLIGTGIVCRQTEGSDAERARVKTLWDDWCKVCDADGVFDLYGMQSLVTHGLTGVGESLLRFRPRRLEDGLPVPLQIQLLEPDMMPLLDADVWPGLTPGHRIRQGKEIDRIGRPDACWLWREHPGDRYSTPRGNDLVRVSSRFVRQIYEPRRPGQLRGVSPFASVLAKLRGVGNFDDAVLERQVLANLYTAFVTRASGPGDPGIDPVTGLAIGEYAPNGQPLAAMEPGTTQELYPGESISFSDPPGAGADYEKFMRQQHLGIASGPGVPYELLTGDIRDISDRTLRVIIGDFRRRCEQIQWQVLIPMFCQPIRDAWADAAALAGILTPEEAARAKRVRWQPQGWQYIHPTQDAQSKIMEVKAGLRAEEDIIIERGDDPEAVEAAIRRDLARRAGRPRQAESQQ